MPDPAINTNPPTGPGSSGVSVPAQVVNTGSNGADDVRPQSGAPAMMGTQTAPSPMIPAQQPQTMPFNPAVARAARTGMGFHALMGTHGEVGPNGTVVQADNKPGDLFRSILAGAITGMASGAQAKMGGGIGSFAVGAGAAQQQGQQQKDKLQQQSQQQFENQQKLQAATSEEQLRKAQISMYNMSKLESMQKIQGGNYTAHKGLVDDAKPIVEAYNATGLKPVAQNLDESDMQKYIASNPGAATLDWQPTGMTHFVDANGITNYQTQWTAYDPKGSVIVPASLIKDWKSSGLLDMHPDLVQNMKKDANGQPVLPYAALTNLNTENTRLKNDAQTKSDQDYKTKEQAANLQHIAAQIAQERATAAASGNEASLRAFELKQEKSGADAQTALTKNNGDWSKLSADQKVALQPMVQKTIDEARQGLSDPLLKEQLQSNDPAVSSVAQERASQLHQQLDDAKAHSIFVPQGTSFSGLTGKPNQKILSALQGVQGIAPSAAAAVASMKPEDIKAYLPTAKLPDNVKAALYEAIGEKPPTVKTVWNPMGQAVGNAVQSVVPVISTATSVLP